MLPKSKTERPIVLFDGECEMCSTIVQFVIKRDPQGTLLFAAQQSEAGQALLARYGLLEQSLDTFVYIHQEQVFTHSTAALQLTKRLNRLWPLCYGLMIIPRPLRDVVYRYVAKNRYKWFGKKESCFIPTPEIRQRFVQLKDLE